MRKTIELSSKEKDRFNAIRPDLGAAMAFWREVAESRGLDPASLFTTNNVVSGLPVGHGKHWCWPHEFYLKHKPSL
jgi:hypothetical protein